MCTLSWMIDEQQQSYHVFFNRDEQKTRAIATPPTIYAHDNIHYLAPIDPQGKGSWICINEFGITICLLNYYQGTKPNAHNTSRGLLVLALASSSSLTHLQDNLAVLLEKNNYQTFTIVAFSLQQTTPISLRWNGKCLQQIDSVSPCISSSVDYEPVKINRTQCYQDIFSPNADSQNSHNLYQYHRSHWPTSSKHSVCMHRDDAHTVSLSHITVSQQKACFAYYPGSPCQGETAHTSNLAIFASTNKNHSKQQDLN